MTGRKECCIYVSLIAGLLCYVEAQYSPPDGGNGSPDLFKNFEELGKFGFGNVS